MCLRHVSDRGSGCGLPPYLYPALGSNCRWVLVVAGAAAGDEARLPRVDADSPEQLIRAVVCAESGAGPSDDTSNARDCRFIICDKRSGKQNACRDRSRKGAIFMLDPWIVRATLRPQSQAGARRQVQRITGAVGSAGDLFRRGIPLQGAYVVGSRVVRTGMRREFTHRASTRHRRRWCRRGGAPANVVHMRARNWRPVGAAVRPLVCLGEQGWLHRVIEDGPSPDSRGRYE